MGEDKLGVSRQTKRPAASLPKFSGITEIDFSSAIFQILEQSFALLKPLGWSLHLPYPVELALKLSGIK